MSYCYAAGSIGISFRISNIESYNLIIIAGYPDSTVNILLNSGKKGLFTRIISYRIITAC